MASNYYYFEGDDQKGPFDVVTLVRKIRTGVITPSTTILVDDGKSDPTDAINLPELKEFFQEASDGHEATQINKVNFDIIRSFKNGFNFIQSNLLAALFTGIFLLIVVLIILGSVKLVDWKIGLLPCLVLTNLALYGYMMTMLRISRGQPAELSYILGKYKQHFAPLLISSIVISALSLLGALLIIPLLFIMALFIFTPLLITERGMGWKEAMSTSRKAVLSSGSDNFGVIFGLVVTPLISLILIPLSLIAFPVSFYALSEIYDEFFYS